MDRISTNQVFRFWVYVGLLIGSIGFATGLSVPYEGLEQGVAPTILVVEPNLAPASAVVLPVLDSWPDRFPTPEQRHQFDLESIATPQPIPTPISRLYYASDYIISGTTAVISSSYVLVNHGNYYVLATPTPVPKSLLFIAGKYY